MAKSIIIIGIMGLMGYMSISRNEPVVGEKAIKNKVIKEHEANKIISFALISKDGMPIPFNFTCNGGEQYRVDMMNFARAMAREHLSTETEFFKTILPNLILKEYPLITIIKGK